SLVLTPVQTLLVSLAGAWLSSVSIYGTGRLVGQGYVDSFKGKRFNRLRSLIDRRGILTVALARIFPTPHWFVNLFMGAYRVKFGEFAIGTFLGLFPMIFIISMFGGTMKNLV